MYSNLIHKHSCVFQVKYYKNFLLLASYIFVPIIRKDHLYFGYSQNILILTLKCVTWLPCEER